MSFAEKLKELEQEIADYADRFNIQSKLNSSLSRKRRALWHYELTLLEQEKEILIENGMKGCI